MTGAAFAVITEGSGAGVLAPAFALAINNGGQSLNPSAYPARYTFGPITASASGGTGPYTYAWSETDDRAGTWSLTNASTAAVTVGVFVGVGGGSSASLKCVATDTATGKTVTVILALSYNSTNDS